MNLLSIYQYYIIRYGDLAHWNHLETFPVWLFQTFSYDFVTCLSNRIARVGIDPAVSCPFSFKAEVPQRSILAPIFFLTPQTFLICYQSLRLNRMLTTSLSGPPVSVRKQTAPPSNPKIIAFCYYVNAIVSKLSAINPLVASSGIPQKKL